MSRDRSGGYTSGFDEMLRQTRSRLADLGGGRAYAPARDAGPVDSEYRTRDLAPAQPIGETASAGPDIEAELNERFGEDWRFEVLRQDRVGDEITVVGELRIEALNFVQSESGRARLGGGGGDHTKLSGSADGISFSFLAPVNAAESQRQAFERARAEALRRCAQML